MGGRRDDRRKETDRGFDVEISMRGDAAQRLSKFVSDCDRRNRRSVSAGRTLAGRRCADTDHGGCIVRAIAEANFEALSKLC